MYTVKPKGINIKANDRSVADGFLQEAINIQWRDGSFRPIPERIDSGITNVSDKDYVILHKVSDEDVINVLMFDSGVLSWYGTIENNVYSELSSSVVIDGFPTVTDFDSFSYAIFNNNIYLMSDSQYFYYKLEYDESDYGYEVTDMYEWKDLVPYFPKQGVVSFTYDADGMAANYSLTKCGCILIRFTLVLDTGEEVLHTPPYMFALYGFNASSSSLEEDQAIKNIHTFINLNLAFTDDDIYDDHISAIKVYASVPDYESSFTADIDTNGVNSEYTNAEMVTQFQEQADESFYLIKTIDEPSDTDKILLHLNFDTSLVTYDGEDLDDVDSIYMINLSTIAAGETMPTDDYSYHKLFGKISSYNNRLIVSKPITVMSSGYGRALSTSTSVGMEVGFKASTEDGTIKGISYTIGTSFDVDSDYVYPRGLIGYPDKQGTYVGFGASEASELSMFSLSENESHNMGCNYSISDVDVPTPSISKVDTDITISCQYEILPIYEVGTSKEDTYSMVNEAYYSSGNRVQFSEAGEYSVWPVENSYRAGKGIIMFVGDNSIDPSNSDFLAPLIIGTSDGIYTANFDTTGTTLIQSITKTANMPAISKESMQVDKAIVFVSDNGLILINNGSVMNITIDYFPSQGSVSYSSEPIYLANYLASYLVGTNNQDSYFPNYQSLTELFFGEYNSYSINDIVTYMKSAKFAYDARRNNLWCCNSNRNFSLVFNLETKQWATSTYKYTKVVESFSTISTSQGEVYSRYLVLNTSGGLDILSSEDLTTEVDFHILTRPIKMDIPDTFKKIERIISRCTLYKSSDDAYFSCGVWGKQDLNKNKINIPLVAYLDSSDDSFPDDIRQDVPIGRMKGKYKALSILLSGKILPESSIDGFDIVAIPVDNKLIR